jgi:hypothetical protein
VISQLNGLFASSQDFQDSGILPSKIRVKPNKVGSVLCPGLGHATLDALNLVDQNIIHTA